MKYRMQGFEDEKHNLSLHNALVGVGPTVNLVRNHEGPGGYLCMQRISVKSCAAIALWLRASL